MALNDIVFLICILNIRVSKSRKNELIWRLYVTIFLMKTLLRGGGRRKGAFIGMERLKTFSDFRRAVYWREAFKDGRAFIGGFTVIKAWT